MPEERAENVIGAVIFFGYIAAALFFTGLIGRDLVKQYNASYDVKKNKQRPLTTIVQRREKAHVFVVLASISFTVLSYQMLSFLIQSYSVWWTSFGRFWHSELIGGTSPLSLTWHQFPTFIWRWSQESALFKDFAEAIIVGPERFWWTQQALLYSLGWNIYMAIEGQRYQIPHLWVYYVLDQILPVSFTQNLFCIAVFLSPNLPQTTNLKAAAPVDQFAVVTLYLLGLSIAPGTINTASFFVGLFAVRALLFAPYWMLRPTIMAPIDPARGSPEVLYWKYRYSGSILAIGGIFLHVRQTQLSASIVAAVEAISDNFAVATLGFDYLIGIFSLILFFVASRV